MPVQTSDFDFELPADLIAQHPMEPRDRARLMVLRKTTGQIEHAAFSDLPDFLEQGDLLIRNNSQVIRARLLGAREATGGRWEGLFLTDLGANLWEILATTRGKPRVGEFILVGESLRLELVERGTEGRWIVRPTEIGQAHEILQKYGQIPLPPYIRKGRAVREDQIDYQTIYGAVPGSVAAPTAGLHFTPQLFQHLEGAGISVADLTLHVGVGTFRPIETTTIERHRMHAEWAEVPAETAVAWKTARSAGKRIVAIGTTSARTLETAAQSNEASLTTWNGLTDIYIKPGHQFRGIDALVTNFHLPKSSLLVLVSAFAGADLIRSAYAEAVTERYRFFSYGDCMLIL